MKTGELDGECRSAVAENSMRAERACGVVIVTRLASTRETVVVSCWPGLRYGTLHPFYHVEMELESQKTKRSGALGYLVVFP